MVTVSRIKSWPWLAPAALLLLAACVTAPPAPPGPAQFSASDTAIIRGGPAQEVYLFGRGRVTLTRIDETVLVDGGNNPLYRNVEVTAGPHAVYFNYRHEALCATEQACAMSLSRDRKIPLIAQVGHVYRVDATYRDGRLWYWITDQSDDNRLVAGEFPDGATWAALVQGLGGARLF